MLLMRLGTVSTCYFALAAATLAAQAAGSLGQSETRYPRLASDWVFDSSEAPLSGSGRSFDLGPSPVPTFAEPMIVTTAEPPKVKWGKIIHQSLGFLAIENGFRYANEEGARHTGLAFFSGYEQSVGNLHGWADGD